MSLERAKVTMGTRGGELMVYDKPSLFFSELIKRTMETTEQMKKIKENSTVFKIQNFGKAQEVIIC